MNRVFKQSFFSGYLSFRMFQGGSELECIAQGSLFLLLATYLKSKTGALHLNPLSKQACAIFAERLCIWINSAKPISMLFFLHSQDLTLMDRVHPSGDTVLTTAVSPFDEFSPRIWSLKRCQRCIYRCCQWAVLGGLNPPFDSQKKTETHFSQWKLKRLGRAEVQWFDCWSLVF